MKKTICMLLLIQGGFAIAQTKTLVTPYGEKVTINPNANNGLTAADGNTQLGGALIKPTTINTTSANTLELKSDGSSTTQVSAIKITDGGQNLGKVLTSDENGVATWQKPVLDIGTGVLVGKTGVNINYNDANFTNTGNYVDLPPGKWLVSANFILSTRNNTTAAGESWHVRSSFTENSNMTRNGITVAQLSQDFVGAKLITGEIAPSSYFGHVRGSVVIYNQTAAVKRYYYIAGAPMTVGTSSNSINAFAADTSVWEDSQISFQRLN